jgi:biotin carboxylase
MPEPLRGIADIRGFFRTNDTPIYFVSPTAFNLLGIDRWVRDFHFVNYFDSFGGSHPNVFVPKERPYREFESIEDINNYLLSHKEVRDLIGEHGGQALFVFFDEETEALAEEAGLKLAMPSAALRHRLDSKIVTTQLGNEAGVPSVPNRLGHATSYEELLDLATGLGHDLVVQTPYGDSGKTTFFIHGEADWDKDAEHMVDQELKVMKRINCRAVAVEAVLTRHGTVVGPVMRDLTGYPELTPYRGGWCGNDIFADALTPELRERARVLTQQFGDRLATEGYLGFFEVDYLVDLDTGELYLGELNPRLSGVTSMTNVTVGAYADMPLFLLHLIEFLDVPYEIDVDEINARWGRTEAVDEWSQLVIKETRSDVELLTAAPRTGLWRLDDDGHASFIRWGNDWHGIHEAGEAFYLQVLGEGDYRYPGADLGLLVSRCRMQDDDNRLTPKARQWIDAIREQFTGVPLASAEAHDRPRDALAFKASS